MNATPGADNHTRRSMLKQTGLGLVGAALLRTAANGQAAAAPAVAAGAASSDLPRASFSRFPRMVQEYLVRRVRAAERLGDQRRAALQTRADAENYVRDVRERIQQCFGPWPEKTPLNARITGVLERDEYSIEKLIFESRPGFLVTANLYVPKGRGGRLPGVVAACGHAGEAKAEVSYQSFAQSLARFGYVTLIFDPLGQGERLQYSDDQMKRYGKGGNRGVNEHLHAGNQQVLVGESFATWRTWDGIRALDYLLTRPEVDPTRIGVTGNSGGGADTTWLCAVEPRIAMAAPQCFVATFRRNLENELPADSEQCPPRAIALGLDHSDFIAAMAPKPVVLIGQEKDFFDVRGLEEAHDRLRRVYGLLGAADNLKLVIESDYHSFSRPSREAMYRWFNRVAGIVTDGSEPPVTLESRKDLQCTPHGQVSELGSHSVAWFTREKSLALRLKRQAAPVSDLPRLVAATLKLPQVTGAPDYRILRPQKTKAYLGKFAAIYAVETEADVFSIVYRLGDEFLESRPPRGPGRALLYVCHQSSDEELRGDPWLAGLVATEGAQVFTCDPRGVGESRPGFARNGLNNWAAHYESDYFHSAHGLMLDYPSVGQKTFDVLRVLAWLKTCGHEEIHLAASGWGTLPATFAAVLSGAVTQVTLRHALSSYSDIAESADYAWPLTTLVPDILAKFDLPDCYRALESKNLRLLEPWDAMGARARPDGLQ